MADCRFVELKVPLLRYFYSSRYAREREGEREREREREREIYSICQIHPCLTERERERERESFIRNNVHNGGG